ncbi:MAG: hydroxyisourate hydrolase [Bacteroidales bacterium]|nr:hydroxyisourate hydrolase [Bacteroidales bacterium]
MKKSIVILLILLFASTIAFAQQSKYQLSSHILDISKGMPATDVKITLQKQIQGNQWQMLAEKQTDNNGRVSDFLPQDENSDHIGVYKLTFCVESYFQSQQTDTFYPYIEVVFEIKDDKHYHVPITLSA